MISGLEKRRFVDYFANMTPNTTLWASIWAGGFAMIPLVICSVLTWLIVFERIWYYRKLPERMRAFHLEAMNSLLRGEWDSLRSLCAKNALLPTANLLQVALERLASKEPKIRANWVDAVQRRRQLVNQEMRRYFWVLGTIGSASPFIGLFGTVVGILRSFQEMARTGSGGFTVVAAGISESLIATAAGIIVAVVAVMAYNAFQTHWGKLVLQVRIQIEELTELLSSRVQDDGV